MSLRYKINLIVAAIVGVLASLMIWLQIQNMRDSVREEIQATNRVTVQLFNRLTWVYAAYGHADLLNFLQTLGRVRANEITFTDSQGKLLYRSPASTYKQGREAPEWFARLILPPPDRHAIELPTGHLVIEAEPSRAVLDGWDDLVKMAWAGAALLLAGSALIYWVVGQLLAPLSQIVHGLNRLQKGDFQTKLPALPGQEAGMIGAAFNRLTDVLQDNIEAHRRAQAAEDDLSNSRELTNLIETHMEAERRDIASALHDEFGQSITAISSLAMSIARRAEGSDEQTARVARLISEEAGRVIEHMHGLIPKLAPMALDALGLEEAFQEMVERVQMAHPDRTLRLQATPVPSDVPKPVALTAYRIAQEGLTNALRHSRARHVDLTLTCDLGHLCVGVQDDGDGPPDDWRMPGHFGLRWLEDRARALGGTLSLSAGPQGGALLQARLPVACSEGDAA